MLYHWNLRDSKCPQVSRTLLSILADSIYATVWMCLGSSSDLSLFQPTHQAFGDSSIRVSYNWYHRHIHVPFLLLESFTSASSDGLSLEFELQQVSPSLQNSSQYSGRCQRCSSLDGLHSSSYFQVLQFL